MDAFIWMWPQLVGKQNTSPMCSLRGGGEIGAREHGLKLWGNLSVPSSLPPTPASCTFPAAALATRGQSIISREQYRGCWGGQIQKILFATKNWCVSGHLTCVGGKKGSIDHWV